jgi:hypothetical protein
MADNRVGTAEKILQRQEESMTARERVRKHRAKLRAEQCSRLEVWIGTWIVEGIRQLAKKKGRETWLEVQDVLEQYLLASGAGPSGAVADSKSQSVLAVN